MFLNGKICPAVLKLAALMKLWSFLVRRFPVGEGKCLLMLGKFKNYFCLGCGLKNAVIVSGGRVFVWPCIQQVARLPLNLMTLQVESPLVYTYQGVPISVTGIAQIKIQGQNEEMLHTACEMFLGKSEADIAEIALLTLEGHQRAIMGTLTVEEIYQDRKKFGEKVFEVASSDLINMGITVVSYTLKDVSDDEGYLLSLGMTRTAQVKRDARIGEAEAKRDSTIREAQAEMERISSRLQNDTEIARARRDYELKKAKYEVESLTKKAEEEMAFSLQATKIKQKLIEEQVKVNIVQRAEQINLEKEEVLKKTEEFKATIYIPADAERYRLEKIAEGHRSEVILEAEGEAEKIRLTGEAEAYAIQAKAEAEAEAMSKKAIAWGGYSEAAIMDMVLDALPKIAEEVAAPLSKTKKITIVSNGHGDVGPAKISEEIFTIISKVPEAVKRLTGVDITRTLRTTM